MRERIIARVAIPARVSLVTLGVTDLPRSTAFYRALGWPLSSSSAEGVVSFFDTKGGLLALFPEDDLAEDAGMTATHSGFRGVALAVNLESPQEVDRAFEQVRAAGGEIVKPPVPTEWGGYSGYFADPDGHLWEVAHNPAWPIGEDGRPQLPPTA
jgi:catechol 2,3-dioxygenase-like lactoylglutathione lyase family enzyme